MATSRTRNGLSGGLILVVVTSVVLVIALAVVLANRPGPPSVPAGQAGPTAAPTSAAPFEPLPGLSPGWDPLTPDAPVAPSDDDDGGGYPTASGSPGPVRTSPTPRPVRSTAAAFTAVAGNGCAETATAGAFASFTAGEPVTNLAGGWTGTGCAAGRFWSVPMSGDAQRDDESTAVTWWFKVGGVTQGRCEVWVFIPKPAKETEAAGKPTHYYVTRGRGSTTVVGQFTVDQPDSRGAWAFGGTFALTGGQLAVELVNRGAGAGGARHAAGQVQIGCWPS
ncbi:hypothetical protein F4553_007637 [Allocatelliglobosispora scoriae]|uniref:Adhesin n=1 Tax=Allocatelliglobosispora scoriae TaxID=643052 RepID=A0A841C4Y4_9ACTN|nr:hypothetical protein [Allocatelliglobosispora scoriae]MBB5874203.1 hypothetical protein [Allocatelliglobosispora scoriae]